MHSVTCHCWRPVGRSVLAELRRFFIGGTPELEDPAFVAIPTAFQVMTDNKVLTNMSK